MNDVAAQSIALSLGVSALVTVGCRRARIPALLPLLLSGLALGTSGLDLVDGSALGKALTGFITVCIGLLIFEGALHLNREELGRAPRAVWGLMTIGAAVTWIGAAAGAYFILGMSIPLAVLMGAGLIVTGPTVVQPILRLVRVTPALHSVLAAEAVLIDPVGVVATVTTLELLRLYAVNGAHLGLASEGLWIFAKPLLGGASVGVLMGLIGYRLLTVVGRSGKPEPQILNLVAIGICMTCVGLGETITPEGGLAAVTICGVLMARAKVLGGTELRAFKELLAIILVGTLFVLLASRFDMKRLASLTWREGVFVLLLIFLIRPASVLLSTWKSRLSRRERLFAATFAPRGIVALSVAAVASVELGHLATRADIQPTDAVASLIDDAPRIELVMFVVIVGSVLLATTFSPFLAWLLRVKAGIGNSILLVGAHPVSIEFAKWLNAHKIDTRVVDTNEARVAEASSGGLDAISGDATDTRWLDDMGSSRATGWVIAWTGNHDVDQIAARWAEDRLDKGHAAIWSSRPARGVLEAADISSGEPISEWVDRLESGRIVLRESLEARDLKRVLGWIKDGRFTLNVPPSKALTAPSGANFIGLAEPLGKMVLVGPEPQAPPAPLTAPSPAPAEAKT